MPKNELEQHPFLNYQLASKEYDMKKTTVAIIGTFPIYEITNSIESDENARLARNQWGKKAFFKYFYGSKGNHFWKILINIYKADFPRTREDCLNILNKNNLFISDTINSCYREKLDYQDSSLSIISLNLKLSEIIKEMATLNLKKICFTSDLAKSLFCKIMRIEDSGRIQTTIISENKIILNTLPTPAGNGRSVWHFTNDYPMNKIENFLKSNKMPYALQYRNRIYTEALSQL